jgi:hypothetical protein
MKTQAISKLKKSLINITLLPIPKLKSLRLMMTKSLLRIQIALYTGYGGGKELFSIFQQSQEANKQTVKYGGSKDEVFTQHSL